MDKRFYLSGFIMSTLAGVTTLVISSTVATFTESKEPNFILRMSLIVGLLALISAIINGFVWCLLNFSERHFYHLESHLSENDRLLRHMGLPVPGNSEAHSLKVKPPSPDRPVLLNHPEVVKTVQVLQKAQADAIESRNQKWIHDAQAAREYLPEVLNKHRAVFGDTFTPELARTLETLEQYATHHHRHHLQAEKDWQELRIFLAEQANSVK